MQVNHLRGNMLLHKMKKTWRPKGKTLFRYHKYPQNKTIIHDYTALHFKFTNDEHGLTLSVVKFKTSFRKCYKVFRWNWPVAENQAIKMPKITI